MHAIRQLIDKYDKHPWIRYIVEGIATIMSDNFVGVVDQYLIKWGLVLRVQSMRSCKASHQSAGAGLFLDKELLLILTQLIKEFFWKVKSVLKRSAH